MTGVITLMLKKLTETKKLIKKKKRKSERKKIKIKIKK